MSALDRVLDRLKNVHHAGDGYNASCPVSSYGQGCVDRDPSLSIGTDAEGNVLLRCFANCGTEAVVDALGLSMADLFEQRNGYRTGEGMPEDQDILPWPEDLREAMSGCAVDGDRGGMQHPPPLYSDIDAGLGGREGVCYPSETASTDQPQGEEWGVV